MSYHVDSETGRLRQVILHRPGLELSRLTPDNVESLLFDTSSGPSGAREEHDAFASALRERGVTVHYFADLLGRGARGPEVPATGSWKRVINDDTVRARTCRTAAPARPSRPRASRLADC
jgi:arginine deiminase